MGSTQDMQLLLAKKDARIRELEIENMELKSKLDKYQSIFPSSPPPASGTPGKKLIKFGFFCQKLVKLYFI